MSSAVRGLSPRSCDRKWEKSFGSRRVQSRRIGSRQLQPCNNRASNRDTHTYVNLSQSVCTVGMVCIVYFGFIALQPSRPVLRYGKASSQFVLWVWCA